MNQLTLEWTEQGQVKSFIVTDQLPTKASGRLRIGRDPVRCDLVLQHPTVSGLHVEIFYDPQQRLFCIRNLRSTNPPLVNQQPLGEGMMPLLEGTQLMLGQLPLRVVAIALDGIAPTVLMPPAPVSTPSPIAQTEPSSPTSPPKQSRTYGLQCPKCGNVSPYEHLRQGCRWCGASLAAAASVLMTPE
jgi:predicted component of type VI protein secretion system